MKSAVELKAFHFRIDDLLSLHQFTMTVKDVIETTTGDSFEVELDKQATDNFGSYATGYRCFLKSKKNQKELYVYFGAIYSNKKKPGIFAEVDQNSNLEHFVQVRDNILPSELYELNKEESAFVKIFLTPEQHEAVMEKTSVMSQAALLRSFFTCVCEAFINTLNK
ncbi:hypothetical protein GW626_05325 [Peribacillus muralis]|uniref:hypothetical protein n=1 Tax=Peribacillus muralis TaxID=264697 RepID=UPI001F4D40DC|nr:hypothetical protein [Peribacillus muralis]MCK1992950.1 hypothetical protein [Peribacillus muralis]MCK2013505.1 hypothetical protein [Peribacillus muralis]